MVLAPIALFAYKRPEHTLKVLTSLSESLLADESSLFIFCDGPKGNEDRETVARVREIAASRLWCRDVTVICQDRNQGLAHSIIAGVSRLIADYGEVIVLEDDILVSRFFLRYMNDALRFYRDREKVMHIAAYMYPVEGSFPETFFYRLASCWGWATWKRAWDQFEPDPAKCLESLKASGLCRTFDHDGAIDLTGMLRRQMEGTLDSWNIRWHATVCLRGGLCLHPHRSYVQNIGLDGSGTHCGLSDRFNVELSDNASPLFGTDVRECEAFYEAVRGFFEAQKVTAFRRIAARLKRHLFGA